MAARASHKPAREWLLFFVALAVVVGIVVPGTIGNHGIAIMSVREGIEFETVLESDCAPVAGRSP